MASVSSSSSPHEKYDVFLSFRGEDTRDGFTSHLYAALCRRSIFTFIDDKLERGDEISQSLLNTIESSKISIIIFSKDYASSRWCLEELVKILDCRKVYDQIVIPVFYKIDPSDIRKQTGTFGDAFAEHQERFRERKEMVQRWRNALTEAANLSGFDSNSIRPESELIETIIKHILKRLSDMSSSDSKNLVGVKWKILRIKSLLSNESNKVCKVGIWGMGGIGKTTLATAVFDEISREFEASHFIQNIREASSENQLRHLQKELLSTILEDGHLNIRRTFTKERLGRKRVLVVFDDVTDSKQIKELIGDLEILGFGSQIIITTRDKQVLKKCGLNDSTIFEVMGLCSDESLQLFQQHAFNQNYPIDKDYMELSRRVIGYTGGVPLALEVLGSFLLGREKFEWESALDELKESPNEVIQTVLKISYEGLSNGEKDLFLDIACFFKEWDKNLVSSFSSHIGISVLIDKALITISYNTIIMHDLVQEMGWEIVRQESINKLGQRSRLWHHDDVSRVLEQSLGTNTIRGLRFDVCEMREMHLNPHALSKMDNLRFLIGYNSHWRANNKWHGFKEFDFELGYNYWRGNYNVHGLEEFDFELGYNYWRGNCNVHGFEGVEFDFTELRCLSWDYYPCTSLPLKFRPENLVVLEMQHSNLKQLWIGVKELANLKYIDLSYSFNLLKVPDLSHAPNLESFIAKECTSLVEITLPSTPNLNKLVNLNLRNCKSLTSLSSGIQLKSGDVILSTSNLKTAPSTSYNMEQLYVDGTAITESPFSVKRPFKQAIGWNLMGCSRLESLPRNICKLKSLQHLNLSGCSNLKMVPEISCNIERACLLSQMFLGLQFLGRLNMNHCSLTELPNNLGQLCSLRILELVGNDFESIPTSIVKLSKLWFLDIRSCNKLQSLPKLPFSTQTVNAECCKLLKASSGLTIGCDGFSNRTLNFTNCSSLDWYALRKIWIDAILKMYSDTTVWWKVTKTSSDYIDGPRGCMCFPGSEIPEWFDVQSIGTSSIELPQGSFNHKCVGFVFCVIVEVARLCGEVEVKVELFSKCKGSGYKRVAEKGFSFSALEYTKSDHVFLGYNCRTCDFRQFSSDTEVIIKFRPIMKKCGIRLLFAQEFEEPIKRSRFSIFDEEEEQDEAHSKRLKSCESSSSH